MHEFLKNVNCLKEYINLQFQERIQKRTTRLYSIQRIDCIIIVLGLYDLVRIYGLNRLSLFVFSTHTMNLYTFKKHSESFKLQR